MTWPWAVVIIFALAFITAMMQNVTKFYIEKGEAQRYTAHFEQQTAEHAQRIVERMTQPNGPLLEVFKQWKQQGLL